MSQLFPKVRHLKYPGTIVTYNLIFHFSRKSGSSVRSYILLLLLLTSHFSFSQDQHLVDSLQNILLTAKQDSNRSKALNRLSSAYQGNNPDKAMEYAKQNLELSEQIGFKKGIANAYNIMGSINMDRGDYLTALDFFKKSLKIRDRSGKEKVLPVETGILRDFVNRVEVYLGIDAV